MPSTMKKHLYRVKQLADQNFFGADKTQGLDSHELVLADEKVETMKSAISALSKKLPPPQANDTEKKLKKNLDYQLGEILLQESNSKENKCVLLQEVMHKSGLILQELAQEYVQHESEVESMVSTPFHKVLDEEFSRIFKDKRSLQKYCLDKDAVHNRYTSKKDKDSALKEDFEEADNKVEASRDVLATEMFSLLAKENEFATYILQLLKLQRGYYETALKNLEIHIPKLQSLIVHSNVRRVFGTPLRKHLEVTKRRIALPLEICISNLTAEECLSEEGLFRIAGSVSKVKRLKASIDSGCFGALIKEYRDVHVLASTLKSYLRELPEPLLTTELHNDWMQSMHKPEHQRLDSVKEILKKLPEENFYNLGFIMQFLAKLARHDGNKMSASNIAIVIAPNILWSSVEAHTNTMNMENSSKLSMLVEFFIKEVDLLFTEDYSQYFSEKDPKGNFNQSCESLNVTDSPKPANKKKKAPVPPAKTDLDLEEKTGMPNAYPSGSTTLRARPKVKATVGVNTEESHISELVNAEENKNGDSNKNFKTVAKLQIIQPKPVAAPRSIDVNRTSKNLFEDVQLRREHKPEVPARPASLQKRASGEIDPTITRTQVSLYSVANKQQASIVNIANKVEKPEKHQLGHDNQMAEKEKFLGHQPEPIDVNYNKAKNNLEEMKVLDLPLKPPEKEIKSQSQDKLNEFEKLNGNRSSHIRTASDGNLINLVDGPISPSALTPPSPRSLNKPTQPPPPPPVTVKRDSDSTDL